MKLRDYFQHVSGTGILATSDATGKVNMAVYGRPHFLDDDDDQRLAFIMSDRLSHDNTVVNPRAAYLYIDDIEEHTGKRLFLTRIGAEADQTKIDAIRRHGRPRTADQGESPKCWLVHFRIDGVRPLVGTGVRQS